ncbi:MAG: hypothetical protein K8S62_00760 [Candidatus Sabulitectum sp.]|nr:hypothetical protein [Candidatus Sabulitectum sp.]
METAGGVDNGSDSVQKVLYRVRKGAGEVFEPGVELIPLSDGLLAEPGIHNQIPDWEEDIPSLVSGLGAPWTGVAGEEKSLMHYFPGWIDLEYSMPGTPEVDVAPGETLVSPPFHMLYSEGGIKSLMRKAESLGWDVGNWRERVPFLNHNLQPVMASGTEVSLSHLLCGERDAEIAVGGKIVCTGKIRADASVSGRLAGEGTTDVSLTVAERATVIPVCLVQSPGEVKTGRDDSGSLLLSCDRIVVLIDPCACGHVYSVKLDGVEYILSSHPEPSEFAWEKPWFGGIHPRISGQRGNPYLLQDEKPETEEYQRELDGLIEKGWLMTWRINHKKYGSLKLDWRVGLVPGVPVLKTSLECEASSGEYLDGNLSVKGFIQPGGSVANSILTCEKFPGLAQGRNHAGAWAHMGKWARVGRKNSFVEAYSGEDGVFYCEDFGKQGCHLSLFSSHDRKKTLNMTWLFGDRDDDATLASVFRAHR